MPKCAKPVNTIIRELMAVIFRASKDIVIVYVRAHHKLILDMHSLIYFFYLFPIFCFFKVEDVSIVFDLRKWESLLEKHDKLVWKLERCKVCIFHKFQYFIITQYLVNKTSSTLFLLS